MGTKWHGFVSAELSSRSSIKRMSDFIFPECPKCGEVSSEGEGVGRGELPVFKWTCPECSYAHIGEFRPGFEEVYWLSSRKMSPVSRCIAKVKNAAKRYLKHKTG